ncbi:hypothetical protein ACFU8I_21720 [Streptomyces sp. NPDC057540]|uniref:hypothetical protein n=1 Tax=Streptomyces sp. NPDC057540 TaxID=3346160 RepID=UPI003691D080
MDDIESLTQSVRRLAALQESMLETTREIQSVITFQTHPDVTALDEELDTMYRGQI